LVNGIAVSIHHVVNSRGFARQRLFSVNGEDAWLIVGVQRRIRFCARGFRREPDVKSSLL
jgi:hypothetical protein